MQLCHHFFRRRINALLSARRQRFRHGCTSSLMLTVTGYGDLTIAG
jgi:hypothetical protein